MLPREFKGWVCCHIFNLKIKKFKHSATSSFSFPCATTTQSSQQSHSLHSTLTLASLKFLNATDCLSSTTAEYHNINAVLKLFSSTYLLPKVFSVKSIKGIWCNFLHCTVTNRHIQVWCPHVGFCTDKWSYKRKESGYAYGSGYTITGCLHHTYAVGCPKYSFLTFGSSATQNIQRFGHELI